METIGLVIDLVLFLFLLLLFVRFVVDWVMVLARTIVFEIRFSVNDILNQNQSITRTQGENYFYDSKTVVLQRYFMLTFTYNIRNFGTAATRAANRATRNR